MNLVTYLAGHGLSPQLDFLVTLTALAAGMAFDLLVRWRGRAK